LEAGHCGAVDPDDREQLARVIGQSPADGSEPQDPS
jgi:hypothetical protein